MTKIVAAGFATDEADDSKCTDESEPVDRRVEEGRAETFAAADDQTKQGITGVSDGGIRKEPANVCLRERDEIAHENGECGENRDGRTATGNHRMPASRALAWAET